MRLPLYMYGLCLLFSGQLLGDKIDPYKLPPCPMAKVSRADVRHIDPGGVGYNQGYTSADLFLSDVVREKWVAFLDVRAHVFNDGNPALNGGLGFRFLSSEYVFGVQGYYDYRETSHASYNQLSLGFEALGNTLDFRISGYAPLGCQNSSLYHLELKPGGEIVGTQEFAMPGASAEVGGEIRCASYALLYFAAGPYYFANSGQHAAGGELRASVTLFDHLKLEGFASYDPVFHAIGQGQLSLILPFGPKPKVRTDVRRPSCSKQQKFQRRAFQNVFRNEIIVVSTKSR